MEADPAGSHKTSRSICQDLCQPPWTQPCTSEEWYPSVHSTGAKADLSGAEQWVLSVGRHSDREPQVWEGGGVESARRKATSTVLKWIKVDMGDSTPRVRELRHKLSKDVCAVFMDPSV